MERKRNNPAGRGPVPGVNWEDLGSASLTRRTMLRLMASSTVGAMAAAGGLRAEASTPKGSGSKGGHLTAGWNLDTIQLLDPAFINVTEQMQIASNIFSGLVYIDEGLVPQPDLAENWTVSKDGLAWTFQLRQGVVFHNGQKFTSEDVLYTYNRTNNPKTGSIHRKRLKIIKSVDKLGDYEVRFNLKSPSGAFLMASASRVPARALTIVCRTALEKMGKDAYNVTPVGTGPFRVTEHKMGARLVLEKNPDYFMPGLPRLDKVTIIPVPEATTAVNALRTGDVQFLNRPPSSILDQLLNDANVQVLEAPDPGFQAFEMNQDKVPAFKDQRVRLAIAKAIDRETLVKRGYFGRAIVGLGPIPAAQKLYFRPELEETSPQRYDPDEARRLWKAAGMPKGFEIKLLTSVVRGNLRGAQVLKPMLEKTLGIVMELDQVDPSIYFRRGTAGDYETNLAGSGADYDPNDSMYDFFAKDSKFNSFGYYNPAVDYLLAKQFGESDVKQRIKLVHTIEDIVAQDAPFAFTHHIKDFVAMRKEVRNFRYVPGLRELAEVTLS